MKKHISLLTLALATWIDTAISLAQPRLWTDQQGRKIEAELLAIEEEKIRIRRTRDGKEFSFPITQLSEPDQLHLEQLAATQADEALSTLSPLEDTRPWPTQIAVSLEDLSVDIVSEEDGKYIYRTTHFQFHSPTRFSTRLVRAFARLFESTHAAVAALPLGLDPSAPPDQYFHTQLFQNREDYHLAGGMPNSGGVYIALQRKILVPFTSLGVEPLGKGYTLERDPDNRTLIHEVTHQVMHPWISRAPIWFIEGIAQYMEMIPYSKGRFRFQQAKSALKEHVESRALGSKNITMLSFEKIISLNAAQWNQQLASDPQRGSLNYLSALLLTYYFFHLDGVGDAQRIRSFLASLSRGEKADTALGELLAGRDTKGLENEISQAYRKMGLRIHLE